ncbi:polysaccharide deacetylase family protein [Brachybacterium sacelli]
MTVALAATALAGCTRGDGSSQGSGQSDGSSPGSGQGSGQSDGGAETSGPSPEELREQKVTQARLQLAQHDPDAAEATLEGLEGEDIEELRTDLRAAREALVDWPDNLQVSHLFFHSLIVDAARAFSGDEQQQGYDDYMCTVDEFTEILQNVYDDGYVLVSPHDLCERTGDRSMDQRVLALPEGRMPLVLSQDDVCYYEYMSGDGFADDLHLDADGRIVNSYTDAEGTTQEGSYDLVPLLDDFLADHPDFSYHGRKGILALTGYNGILGYRSSAREYGDDPQALETAKEQARTVADALKEDGWELASHSWGHLDIAEVPFEKLTADFDRWDEEVRPLTGETDLLILPFGADLSGVEPYDPEDPRYRLVRDHGFDYVFTVDGTAEYWAQLHDGCLRQSRMNVDGIRLRANARGEEHSLEPFFDSSAVIDHARPGM